MKILHLSDLHIGKIIYEQSLLEDQEYMLKQIEKIIEKEKIEAVLISGDIYDRSIPPADAVDILNKFLNTLIKTLKVKVFIISGNHDSKERLNFGSQIFENDGLYIQTTYTGKIRKVELTEKINIYMLPFIKPIEVKQYFENTKIETYNDAIKQIISKEKIDKNKINILMAHQFVTSGTINPETSESETINIGGIDNVDASNFSEFDYVALGHIHGPQKIGNEKIRYSGTMLKYSFSEVAHNKSAVIIEIKEGELDYKLKPLIPLRDMRKIQGPIEELIKEENYKGTNQQDYIKAIITNEEAIYDAIGQIRKIYPNTLSLDILNSKSYNSDTHIENFEKIKENMSSSSFAITVRKYENLKENEQKIYKRRLFKSCRKNTTRNT